MLRVEATVPEPVMFASVLRRVRERVRLREYVMTTHADDEMDVVAKFSPLGKLVLITVFRE